VPARPSDARHRAALSDRALQLYGLALVGGAYFLGRLMLTVLVSTPYDRYLLPSMVFLPGIVAASLFELWRRMLRSPSRT
ncbi:MAG: hypothetical protein KJO07_13075, partial [Deltaproteobacteria bacterium]|nr:hypothetical protein [Deltaproteobacteria bacterium]